MEDKSIYSVDGWQADGDLTTAVNVLTMISLVLSFLVLIVLIAGQVFYHVFGPIRGPGFPAQWARTLLIYSIIIAIFIGQLLQVLLQFQQRIHVSYIGMYSRECTTYRLSFACKMALNWSLVVLATHVVLSRFKPVYLSGYVQLFTWIATLVFLWVASLCTAFLVLDEQQFTRHDYKGILLKCHVFATQSTQLILNYIPVICLVILTIPLLPDCCYRKRFRRMFRYCCRTDNQTIATNAMKWIFQQSKTARVFQILCSLSYILAILSGVRLLDIIVHLLFITGAFMLKDVRELALILVCRIFCLYCTLEDENKNPGEGTNYSNTNQKTKVDPSDADSSADLVGLKKYQTLPHTHGSDTTDKTCGASEHTRSTGHDEQNDSLEISDESIVCRKTESGNVTDKIPNVASKKNSAIHTKTRDKEVKPSDLHKQHKKKSVSKVITKYRKQKAKGNRKRNKKGKKNKKEESSSDDDNSSDETDDDDDEEEEEDVENEDYSNDGTNSFADSETSFNCSIGSDICCFSDD